MKRRDFVLTAAALAGASATAFFEQQPIAASVEYPGRTDGHRLRDSSAFPEPTETVEAQVLIAGGGIAGLTAAWQLKKRGIGDVLLVPGPEPHGNAAAGRDGDLVYPTGAHYLPLPSMQSLHVREMLADLGVILGDPFAEKARFDERCIVHAPAERVLRRGTWQEGYLPSDALSARERADHARFFAIMESYTRARGSDGRRAFAVPLELSSADAHYRALDLLTFKAWLDQVALTAPTLHWYLDYCCRDDFGRRYDEVSAWAGLHYFCSRDGNAINAERGAVLTWPQGLAALAAGLSGAAQSHQPWPSSSVASLRTVNDGVEAIVLSKRNANWQSIRVKARYAVAAMPLFVLQHVLVDATSYGFVGARDVPEYAPWLVSNFIMRAFPEEQPGAPLSWDNVVYRESGLGYVVSTHQDIRMSRPDRTVFTAYYALSDFEPALARRWLDRADIGALTRMVSRDLRVAYGWRLPLCVEHVAITARAHAMAIPRPGFLSNQGNLALRNAAGPIFFAHADLSGMSLFEEAAWWGYRAACRIAKRC